MSSTLPLFQDLDPPAASSGDRGAGSSRSDNHLRAAWRLSRAMKRFPDRSAEQTRAGLAICRHLQALLAETPQGPQR